MTTPRSIVMSALNPVAPGRCRLHLTLCSRGFGCAPATTIVAL